MQHEARMAATIQEILTTTADRVALETKAIIRERIFTGSSLLQMLVFSFFDTRKFSCAGLAHQAAVAGAEVSPQAARRRLNASVLGFLKQMLSEAGQAVVLARSRDEELLQRFPGGVYLIDSTTINLPEEFAAEFSGCGGARGQSTAALKVQVRIEVLSGRCEIQLEAGRDADVSSSIQHLPLPPDSLRLADIGYLSTDVLQSIDDHNSEFVTRMPAGMKLHVTTGAGEQCLGGKALYELLDRRCPRTGYQVLAEEVLAGAEARLPCRLVAIRASADVVRRRIAGLEKEAKRRNRPVSADQRAAAHWTIFLTNIPADKATWKEIVVLYRLRWQIELLFKAWKAKKNFEIGKLAQQFAKPVYCMIALYSKLLGVLMRHWTLLTTCWHHAELSFMKSTTLLNQYLPTLALTLNSLTALRGMLTALTRALTRAPRLDKRTKQPSSHQLLTNAELLTWGLES